MADALKKIMLIQPWKYHDEGVAFHDLSQEWRNGPYNLLCLATQLMKINSPIKIVDLQPILVLNGGRVEACLEYLRLALAKFRPDIVGVSFFSYQFLETKVIVEQARSVCQELALSPIFIAGGIHASIEPKLTVEQLGFDYAFVGEGDIAIVDLALGKDPDQIPGITTGRTHVVKQADSVNDLNSLPFPDWSLCDYKFYATPSSGKIAGRKVSTLDIMMGRGCAYHCSFCAYSTLSNLRFYSAEYLVEQIREMRKLYGIDSVYFIDSSIGNNRRLLEDFCEKYIQSGLVQEVKWYANIRSNQVDEPLLRFMWNAGCRSLFYGFESGSQRVLDLMNKKNTVEQNIKAAELHKKL